MILMHSQQLKTSKGLNYKTNLAFDTCSIQKLHCFAVLRSLKHTHLKYNKKKARINVSTVEQ